MVLLFGTDPDLTLTNTLCCDSTVGAYKHSDPEEKGRGYKSGINPMGSSLLRPVTSVWLGAVRRRVQIQLCTEQRV